MPVTQVAPEPASNAARVPPQHRRPILFALMATTALAAMDTTIVSTAIPQIVGDLGGFSLFSWVFSTYLLTQTVTIPHSGWLVRRIRIVALDFLGQSADRRGRADPAIPLPA